MIEGLGIEIVEVARFKRALKRWGKPFLKRLFTEAELEYCLAKRSPEAHLAARFAAKISFFKAIGRRVPFRSLGVKRDSNGRPSLKVSSEICAPPRSSLTITHTREFAMALVLLESES